MVLPVPPFPDPIESIRKEIRPNLFLLRHRSRRLIDPLLVLDTGGAEIALVIAEEIEHCSAVFTKLHAWPSPEERVDRFNPADFFPHPLLKVYQRKIASSHFCQKMCGYSLLGISWRNI